MIATRFPSYLVKHPNKVVWLVHQMRQVYDLLGTGHSDFSESPRDARTIEMIRAMDQRTLGEARALYSISKNPSGMSTFGVPYSPIVPSFTRCDSGHMSLIA